MPSLVSLEHASSYSLRARFTRDVCCVTGFERYELQWRAPSCSDPTGQVAYPILLGYPLDCLLLLVHCRELARSGEDASQVSSGRMGTR